MNDNTEYTPTTEAVREIYADSRDRDYYSPSIEKARQYLESGGGKGEFDRWLAERDREVADQARKEALREVADEITEVELAALKAKWQSEADAWEQGKQAWADYILRLDEADAAGQGVMIKSPVNPYGQAAKGTQVTHNSDLGGATKPPPLNAYPADAGEFAARWNAMRPVRRERWMETLVENAQIAMRLSEAPSAVLAEREREAAARGRYEGFEEAVRRSRYSYEDLDWWRNPYRYGSEGDNQ